MRWLRRAHLFSGLLLVPWILIYGISGFLFNHGRGGGKELILPIPANAIAPNQEAGEQAGQPPSAEQLAKRLVQAIATSKGTQKANSETAPDAATEARLSGAWLIDFVADEVPGAPAHDGMRYRLTLPSGAKGEASARLQARPKRSSRTTRIGSDTFASEREAAEARARDVLANSNIEARDLRIVGGPTLRMQLGDRNWAAGLTRDRATESDAQSFDLSRLLRRLHVTHGYGRSDAVRIVWAVLVDVLAFAMVLWSLSGIAMWWQKRSLRRTGLAALVSATIGSTALAVLLYQLFQS